MEISKEMKCEFKNNLVEKPGRYACVMENFQINKPNTRIETFDADHLPGKTNNDVEEMLFFAPWYKCNIEYFPRGLGNHFNNLRKVAICGCGLKQLSSRDMIGLEDVSQLDLAFNEIESLPRNLLKNMTNLTHISFQRNKLQFIDSRMFEHIKNQLVAVNFGQNRSIDAFYDKFSKFVLKAERATRTQTIKKIDELLTIIDNECKRSKPNSVPKIEQSLDEEFKALWSSRRFTNFSIIVENKEIKVHKCILGIRSPVFAAMFENGMEESQTDRVTIRDFSACAVEDFLQFLYTGEIPDETNTLEIFALASKYDVQNLRSLMEETIEMNIGSEDAIEIFKLGYLYESKLLETAAYEELIIEYPELKLSDNMKHEPISFMELIKAKRKKLN